MKKYLMFALCVAACTWLYVERAAISQSVSNILVYGQTTGGKNKPLPLSADGTAVLTAAATVPAADAGTFKTAPEDGGAFHNWTQYETPATQTTQNLAPVAQDAGVETNQVCYVITNNCALTAYLAMGTGAATLTAASGAATDGIPVYPGTTRKICGEGLPALYHRASADSGVCLSVEKLTRP